MVEVALAVLIVGVGLMAMFGLLPSGLRLSEDAEASTRHSLFAETVLSSFEGAAAGMTDAGAWSSVGQFQVAILSSNVPGVGMLQATGGGGRHVFPCRSRHAYEHPVSVGVP